MRDPILRAPSQEIHPQQRHSLLLDLGVDTRCRFGDSSKTGTPVMRGPTGAVRGCKSPPYFGPTNRIQGPWSRVQYRNAQAKPQVLLSRKDLRASLPSRMKLRAPSRSGSPGGVRGCWQDPAASREAPSGRRPRTRLRSDLAGSRAKSVDEFGDLRDRAPAPPGSARADSFTLGVRAHPAPCQSGTSARCTLSTAVASRVRPSRYFYQTI
jgi:hypothetical protein